MKISQAVRKETGHIALGVAAGSALMIGVFALLHRLDYTVVLGALLGSVFSVLNFLLMGLTVQRAMDHPDRAELMIKQSYTRRMLLMVLVMIVGFAAPCFHVVAVVIPFLLPRITILVMQALGLYKPQQKGGEKK